jgi:hypothetical protein
MTVRLKSILLAMAAVLLVQAPSAAIAGEPVLDPPEGDVTFAGSSEGTPILRTHWFGGLTCGKVDVSGTIKTGGKSGSMALDMTGCHIMDSGITIPCQSLFAPLADTIALAGSFETTYLTDGKTKPGVKFTIPATQIRCSAATIALSGSVLGTLSTPGCGVESAKGTLSFSAWSGESGVVQEHTQITGTGSTIMLTSTVSEKNDPAGLTADLAVGFSKSVKVTCL